MFGLILMWDILIRPASIIKGVIYLKIMYQLIKSPITLNSHSKFGNACVGWLGQMLTKS